MEGKMSYCDHCGDPLTEERTGRVFKSFIPFSECPWSTESTNKGESALLCLDCVSSLRGEEEEEED